MLSSSLWTWMLVMLWADMEIGVERSVADLGGGAIGGQWRAARWRWVIGNCMNRQVRGPGWRAVWQPSACSDR